MKKCFNIFALFLIIIEIGLNIVYCDRIDLSDKNPIVYCLKEIKKFTFQQVKDYLLKIQDLEYALENGINDKKFSLCIEQRSKDNDY